MNKDTEQLFMVGEASEETQENAAEAAAEAGEEMEKTAVFNSTGEVADITEIDRAAQENFAVAVTKAPLSNSGEVETVAETDMETEEKITEVSAKDYGPRENESIIAWSERLERESRAADERVKQTAAALKSAREVEAEAKRESAHTRKRLQKANQQVRETLDNKYRAECTAEVVIKRLQAHKIQAAKSAAEQAVKEARERARYEAEELKWKSKKAAQEARFRAKWEAGSSDEPGEEGAPVSRSVNEVKEETKREAAQIRDRLHQAILQAKREALEAPERARREAEAAGQEIGQEVKDRIEKLHLAILRAIANRNEIKIQADAADERWDKKAAALKSARESYEEATREAAEARKRLREAMSKAKKESREARDRAKRKAREATMVASGNELSGFVRIQIARPVTPGPIREFELALAQANSFEVESVGGTADDGAYIDIYIEEPVHLLGILSQMPYIESFWKNDKGIKVELNTAVLN